MTYSTFRKKLVSSIKSQYCDCAVSIRMYSNHGKAYRLVSVIWNDHKFAPVEIGAYSDGISKEDAAVVIDRVLEILLNDVKGDEKPIDAVLFRKIFSGFIPVITDFPKSQKVAFDEKFVAYLEAENCLKAITLTSCSGGKFINSGPLSLSVFKKNGVSFSSVYSFLCGMQFAMKEVV